jgi:hypothetical protein
LPTWPPPHSWQDREVVTAAQMNQIRDELNTLKASINDDGTIGLFVAANSWTRYRHMVTLFGMSNNAALTPLPELTVPIGPNQTWYFDYTLIVVSASSSQYQVTPSVAVVAIAYGGTGRPTPGNDSAAVGAVGPIYMGGTSNLSGLLQRIFGTVVTGASGGNLTMQVAQKTADGNSLQVFPGSSLVAFRIS